MGKESVFLELSGDISKDLWNSVLYGKTEKV